jgi:catalase
MFRFSLAPGAPDVSDLEQHPRSLVARLDPGDGTTMDLVMINVPFVFVNDPADFAPFFRALTPDPATGKPDPEKVKAHPEKHPEAARFIEFLEKSPIPASYATAPYYAVHTFYFTNAKGERRPARWIAEPAAGRVGLTEEQAKGLTSDYLQEELRERAEKGPVAWDVYLQFPEPGDPLVDASVAWPEDRKKVKVGRLELASVDAPGSKGPCDEVMFDPTMLLEGRRGGACAGTRSSTPPVCTTLRASSASASCSCSPRRRTSGGDELRGTQPAPRSGFVG